jgi:hypothetical protein
VSLVVAEAVGMQAIADGVAAAGTPSKRFSRISHMYNGRMCLRLCNMPHGARRKKKWN